MTLLAKLIAKEEGFGIPNTIPTKDNNPGDLRHSPHSSHAEESPDAIGIIDNVADGWADLERQLQIYGHRGFTLREMVYSYAPPTDHNFTSAYLNALCSGGGWTPDTLVSIALQTIVNA